MPNYGHLSLSCTKIERPSPPEKPSCKVRLFVQKRSRKYRQKVTATTLFQTAFHRVFSTSLTNGPRSLSRVKAGTHPAFREGSHTAAHTPKQGRFGRGWYHYPRTVPHVSETLRGRVSERRTLPLLGLGHGCSQRTQRACGTAMRSLRVAVPRRRGPAGLRDLFRFCRNCGLYILRSGFLRVRGMGGITTLGAFHTVWKPCVAVA